MLRDLAAAPRPTGSAAIGAARDRCAEELEKLGFATTRVPFEFSGLPGRFGTPVIGAAAVALVGLAAYQGALGARYAPLTVMVAGSIVLALVGLWMARTGVLHAPVMRESGENLVAVRPGRAPVVWLSAHLDTKSQPVSSLARGTGIALQASGVLAMFTLALKSALGSGAPPLVWAGTAVVTLLCAIPVVMSVVGDHSPGALDNASGVATILAAAGQLTDQDGIGVLLTDAEELGLAGARAWRDAPGVVVLNCDGVDDTGGIRVMYSRKAPQDLLDAAAGASQRTGVPFTARRLPLGLLTDSVAFTDAGAQSVTFSRGTFRSLARVHSRRDDLDHLRGDGVAETATLIAATARAIAARALPLP